ncbi:MAG: aminotransferase class III-fold pyridoxal phosphate-dependent enzyme [Capnocytophaga sp.]|nr:aminotransferase class III-fold pyridoxal phosphate-dependent enzyme [Capnocytophaga sp.]
MKLFDVYPLYPITPVRAEGVYVYDENDTRYLDLYGGHAVISVGHSHPYYVGAIQRQISKLGFYSNAVQNPLQEELADKLGRLSDAGDYQLFLCNSGAEANENALKMASFVTGNRKILAFKNSFHGRTSAAVAVTDNPKIVAPINALHEVVFVELGDLETVRNELEKGGIAAVIIECIQGIGGLDIAEDSFYQQLASVCIEHHVLLIADEVQSGYGRTGDFFAFQQYGITPDLITIAKGMGNGFPIGGVLIHSEIKPKYGMLGTTFGGNHLACAAAIAVLDIIEKENLMENARKMHAYFVERMQNLPHLKAIKGRGLMLGLEFDFEVAELRKTLIFKHHIFTGGANNKNVLRILPSLTIRQAHIERLLGALYEELS